MHKRIVAFAGPKHCGKSTAAKHLIKKHGYVRFSFADPIRAMLAIMGVTAEELSDPVLKEQPCVALMGKTPRFCMQSLGTDWGREMIHEDIWVEIARRRLASMPEDTRVVLDDCRFDNEAKAFTDAGGVILEITRPGLEYNLSHPSEAGLSRSLITHTVANDRTLGHLISDVEFILGLQDERQVA